MKRKAAESRPDVPWSKRQELPDAQVRDAADQYEASRRLLDAEPPASGVLLPLMNNAAIAIELYLKCLSAERVYLADTHIPAASRVHAAPAVSDGRAGHMLVGLLQAVPEDLRAPLEAAFAAGPGRRLHVSLRAALAGLEGAFQASRYPFEVGHDVSRFKLDHLMVVAEFLGEHVSALPRLRRITWK